MGSKIKISEVKTEVEAHGWKLISTTYTNLKTPLELECPEGHQVDIAFEDIRKLQVLECPICSRQSVKKLKEKTPKKKGYRILALDQSTHITGWALFEDNTLISYGKWEAKSEKATARISEVKHWLAHQIETLKADECVLEGIQLQKFGQGDEAVLTFEKLAHLQGVLMDYLYENGIPFKVVPVATWRNFSNIKGKSRTERKKSAQMKVEEFYGVKATQDESDSILIGKWAVNDNKSNEMIEF